MNAVLQAVEPVKSKKEREVTVVEMQDGRKVEFAGSRRVLKEVIIDESKIVVEQGVVQFETGAVSIRFDLKDGTTRTFALPVSMIAQFAGHGAGQKYGDELASTKDKPLTDEDMLIALEDMDARIQKGEWKTKREGNGGVSGAGIVIRAISEASGKDILAVKAFLQKKLDADENLTRQALYASFRNPTTKTGQIIARLEAEKAAKTTSAVDADAELDNI